eukprot:CAMPEP_0173244630 /NCGR_PEP_ID=MMETSP1142-20121109/16220_1 /TAXON_ID=483371 /ORGANISM="non described non described, Strain CCMP2298" /LENGTH=215 /DNA_ID=CAMNT_0014176467 /DNA_START=377 /DNA_END=1021 /DNA_ORIENTATION=-
MAHEAVRKPTIDAEGPALDEAEVQIPVTAEDLHTMDAEAGAEAAVVVAVALAVAVAVVVVLGQVGGSNRCTVGGAMCASWVPRHREISSVSAKLCAASSAGDAGSRSRSRCSLPQPLALATAKAVHPVGSRREASAPALSSKAATAVVAEPGRDQQGRQAALICAVNVHPYLHQTGQTAQVFAVHDHVQLLVPLLPGATQVLGRDLPQMQGLYTL